jgi:hypothetical protein
MSAAATPSTRCMRGGDANPVMARTLAEQARIDLTRGDIAQARRDMDHALAVSAKTNQSVAARASIAMDNASVTDCAICRPGRFPIVPNQKSVPLYACHRLS